jgi:hypothetical protein
MTEAEWLACTDPTPMLEFLRGKASNRKLRLVAVAFTKHIWELLTHEQSRRAVDVAERFADGLATGAERLEASAAANGCCIYVDGDSPVADRIEGYAAEAALNSAFGDNDFPPIPTYATTCAIAAARAAAEALVAVWEQGAKAGAEEAHARESVRQSNVVREILGNVFRPVKFDPSCLAWHDGMAVKMAQVIYEGRAFEQLPLLADGLEDAGCDNEDLIRHCRSEGPHWRGCWALDLVLGKT